jgi:superfamily II DNA/RNA helicase
MTLLGYFNSLRDLGGSRRIIEDEVLNRLPSMTRARRRFSEESAPHFQNRRIKFNVVELTSRESNADVARAKRKLEQSFFEVDERVDVAIATNMISVGLDITRLGLMVVLGQPKTTAEYIQASSRVGRDEKRPGLVVTLLNVHKPRDRSHFERFEHFHETFYRSVEATSVTPFSPRAIDRALPGVVVGLTRHGRKEFTAPRAALEMASRRAEAAWVAAALEDRAKRAGHAADASDVHGRVTNLLDDWHRIATEQERDGAGLQYQREVGTVPPLLHTPLDPALANLTPPRDRFKANRSLRDVEPSVNLFIRIPGTDRILEEG